MKAIIAAIAALTAMGSFAGSAIAQVSFSIRFGSSPTYRSNIYQGIRPRVPFYQNNYERYQRHPNSSVIVREVYPSSAHYGNSWNNVVPRTIIRRSNIYERHYDNYGDRYIVEKRIIRVR